MAKKKVEELTIEEKLQNALIPEKDQPYKIPQNWCWVHQGSICSLINGEKINNAEYPYLDVKYLRGTKEKKIIDNGNFVSSGTKLILVDGENSGEVFTAFEGGYMGSTFKVLQPYKNVNANYLEYFILTKKDFYKQFKRGTAIPHLDKALFRPMPFPLPPLAEQERIANKLDNYISKLDEAKEKLEKVVDTYNYRKNLILHKAFTGQLTKNWRKENKFELDDDIKKKAITKDSMLPDEYLYEIPENWRWVRLGNIILISKETTDDFSDKKIKYIGLENIEKNGGINSVGDISEVKSLKNVFHKGQILYGKLRPYLNKHDIADFDGVCSTDILVLDSNSNTTNIFVNYYLSDIHFIDYVVYNSRGIHLPRITTKILLNASFPLPPLEEQKEIVKILDSFLTKEKQAKEIAEKEIERVEDLKKNLLTRAFGGLLGTNDPNEENSIELLKTVM